MDKTIRMDEYCSSVRDGTHDTPKPTTLGFPLVTSRAINNNSIDFNACYFISKDDYDKINKRSQVDKWDVLMTMIGTVGRLFLVRTQPEYAIKNIALFKVGDEERAKWLYYYLSNKSVQDYFEMIASGTSQHFIGLSHLRKLKIDNFNESSKDIVNILSAYDDLIENNNKRIALLEKAAQELYKEWFVRFRFPGYEKAKFVNGLPEGWNYVKLGKYANISTGKCNREDAEDEGIYPLFDRSQEIKKSNVWIKDCEAIIVPGEGTSFIPRYFQGKFNLHQRCYCVEPKLPKTGKFLYQTLMLNRIYFLYVATGATVPSLRQNNFTGMKILMPEMRLVTKFDDVVSSFMNEINSLSERNKNLIKQRDLLLPRLMSGKLEV